MVRVPVANPYRQSGSRSASTTASSAKGAKKTAAKSTENWTEDDRNAARLQGWGVFEIVDEKTRKVFYEVQLTGVRFDHDGFARAFVEAQNKAGDELAIKALRVVFRSKAGAQGRTK